MIGFFFFNDTATTEIYTLSLHDALPISWRGLGGYAVPDGALELLAQLGRILMPMHRHRMLRGCIQQLDRKSTRLNSSHANISYAVFCLKKKQRTART